MKDDDQQKQKSEWVTVTYADKKLLAWYREYLKRRELGLSNEHYDIPDPDDCYPELKSESVKTNDGDKSA